ncbi:MAG: sigma-70 family RNA polymerase sigma factor [Anaerolineales bacterium]|nr:sigma-70 family RNA polymerase sigma factor [Anaerolineales bacterium]
MSEAINEAALIQAAQAGDLDAFNRLVISYQTVAYNVAYRLVGDDATAQDATQDAFISAYRSLGSFKGGSFKAWLLRIVTNACYDELRRQKRRPQLPLEPVTPDGEDAPDQDWMADPGESPEDLAERAELNTAIQRCLNQLDDEFRTAVVLIDVQGMEYGEVAEILKRPLGTVKSRLARARSRMQDCLRGFAELLPEQFRLTGEETP